MKLSKLLVSTAVLGGMIWASTDVVSAHGYIANPPSRAYQGSLEKNAIGWTAAQQKYGAAADNPQGLETGKGFGRNFGLSLLPSDIVQPAGTGFGPEDGKITSANDILGSQMAVQKENYWKSTTINTGDLDVTWHYTATHPTSRWSYYITKQNWNPNKTITRDDLELINDVQYDGSQANTYLTHTIKVPEDRKGYHVIVSAWDVADTGMAFYQTLDVNVDNDSVQTEVAKPKNLTVKFSESNRLGIQWENTNQDIKEFEVYRNNQLVGTSKTTEFIDEKLTADTSYSYTVVAINKDGKKSEHSQALVAKTLSEEESEQAAPTVPGYLHSMGVSETSVDLMWGAAIHETGISHYEIYRDGIMIAKSEKTQFTDNGLSSATSYRYTVRAVAVNGQVSEMSNILNVTTKEQETSEVDGTWDKTSIYTGGEVVTYKTGTYKAAWYTVNDIPDESDVWTLIDGTEEWSSKKAYQAKSVVQYNGQSYEAKFWTKGNIPGESTNWMLK
ncbi:lytic polysaccharide monooxygenase [Vagococcus xieshaowenii]|nr:lytic polysaccharide monooxygenase [Vagococcus xieshaowenii]